MLERPTNLEFAVDVDDLVGQIADWNRWDLVFKLITGLEEKYNGLEFTERLYEHFGKIIAENQEPPRPTKDKKSE